MRKKPKRARRRRSRARQPELDFRTHGGRRRGAGRKPRGKRAGVSHARREPLASRHPVLITMKVLPEVWSLRSRAAYNRIWQALRKATGRFGFRVVHFSVQRDHVHLLVEAKDARALSKGMQGLAVRIARALNKRMQRKGTVWADRYHSRILRTPKQVRSALRYTLSNAKKHGIGTTAEPAWVDAMSSSPFFDGWRTAVHWNEKDCPERAPPTSAPRTWLLREGWRRAGGRLDPDRVPGPAR